MHPQSNPRTPHDILTLVINQLGSERRYNELNACSRTCRILLHPCRVYLFSTITIEKNGIEFVALLKKNSTLSEYIQELTYIPVHAASKTSKDLANAFLLLRNIKTLYFHGNNYGRIHPRLQHALAHLFGSQSMSRIYIYGFEDLPATLLSSCLTLKHLTLTCCISPCETYDNTLGAPPQLLSLDLLDYRLSEASKELPKMRRASGLPILDLSTLKSLSVGISGIYPENFLDNILRLTPRLDYLHCSVLHGTTPDSWAQKLPIVMPTLRSLKLTWDVFSTPNELAFPGLINILETLAYQPNCINELFLALLTTRFEGDVLLDLDWEMLDQVLADRSGFPELEKLTIQLWSRSRFDWVNLKAMVQAKFEETTKFPRLLLAANDYLDFKFEVHD